MPPFPFGPEGGPDDVVIECYVLFHGWRRHFVVLCRGVGCIFIEMITGIATFPGSKDSTDQLDKIWKVSFDAFCPIFTCEGIWYSDVVSNSNAYVVFYKVLGTPTEKTWEGVSRYPNYKLGPFQLDIDNRITAFSWWVNDDCEFFLAKFGKYKPQRLSVAFPKLLGIPHAEDIANQLLQVRQYYYRPSLAVAIVIMSITMLIFFCFFE